MGLTNQSTKTKSLKDMFDIEKKDDQFVIALAGNPNTGKSTVFNYLTGLKQHTGNWPGKTVATARGDFTFKKQNYSLIDLPGTYSLFALSQEEVVARDFICFGNPDAVIVVCDANSLERNLNLAFQ
ncbi:MAG: FeoB small GTPase domain-containing protein, partial [Peptostreptococcaceae bacterium]